MDDNNPRANGLFYSLVALGYSDQMGGMSEKGCKDTATKVMAKFLRELSVILEKDKVEHAVSLALSSQDLREGMKALDQMAEEVIGLASRVKMASEAIWEFRDFWKTPPRSNSDSHGR